MRLLVKPPSTESSNLNSRATLSELPQSRRNRRSPYSGTPRPARAANSPTNGRAGNELGTPPPTLPAKKRAEGEIGRRVEDDREPWLAVELKNPAAFQQIYLVEQHTRIRRFEVQCRDEGDDRWQMLYRGGRMNYCSVRLPEPVTAECSSCRARDRGRTSPNQPV